MISEIGGYLESLLTASMRNNIGSPFQRLDSNEDGSLDKEEIATMVDDILNMTGQSTDADELLSRLDTDGDGKVSLEEFEAGRPEGMPPPPPGMTGGMKGGNLQSLMNLMNESEDEESLGFLSYLDENGDGVIDAEEAAGVSKMVQQYQNRLTDLLGQSGGFVNFSA